MENVNILHEPQRLNSLGYIITILKTFVGVLKQFAVLVAYLLYKYRDILFSPYFWIVIVVLFSVISILALINFRTFKYYIDETAEEFVVTKGFFNKSKIVIKFSNILQVNISQNIIQKALSLYSLTVDTAGSDKVEVDLYALDGQQAKSLKKYLLSKITGNENNVVSDLNDEVLIPEVSLTNILSLSSKNILLFSLFSGYRQGLALFFAFIFSIYQQIDDVFDTFKITNEDVDADAVKEIALNSILTFVILGGIILVAIPFVINIVRYYFKYYNFHIVKNEKGNFSMQYGLIKQVNTIFNRDKIQVLNYKQNQILKKFGIGLLSLKQLVTDFSKEDKSSIEIPGIANDDKLKVYGLTFGEQIFADFETIKPRFGLFINRMVKMGFFYIILTAVILLIDYQIKVILPIILVLLLINSIYNYLYYKSYSLRFSPDFLIKNYGVWNEKELIIPIQKIQGVQVSQTYFQKKANSANLNISTASKMVSFNFFDRDYVNYLANYVLYTVEK